MACGSGSIDIARFLIAENVDIDGACIHGWTPLFVACCSRHIELACVLISEGADHELLSDKGRTAFSYLQQNSLVDRIQDRVDFDVPAAKAELEKAVRDYETLRACVPILK